MAGAAGTAICNRDRPLFDIVFILHLKKIYHTIEKSRQAVKNLRPGDFLFLPVSQGFISVIGRLQGVINLTLLVLAHTAQFLGGWECVDHGLHRADGADIAAGRPLRSGGITAILVVFVLAGYALHLRGIGAVPAVDDLAVLACFGAVHIAGNFRYSLHKATAPVMDMAAGLALYGLYVTAVLCVFLMVRA